MKMGQDTMKSTSVSWNQANQNNKFETTSLKFESISYEIKNKTISLK